jgi:hypothetical protein
MAHSPRRRIRTCHGVKPGRRERVLMKRCGIGRVSETLTQYRMCGGELSKSYFQFLRCLPCLGTNCSITRIRFVSRHIRPKQTCPIPIPSLSHALFPPPITQCSSPRILKDASARLVQFFQTASYSIYLRSHIPSELILHSADPIYRSPCLLYPPKTKVTGNTK